MNSHKQFVISQYPSACGKHRFAPAPRGTGAPSQPGAWEIMACLESGSPILGSGITLTAAWENAAAQIRAKIQEWLGSTDASALISQPQHAADQAA